MITFLVIGKFTDQGIRNVRDTVKRAEAVARMAKQLGITIRENYWFLGQFDVGFIADAPDEASMAALELSIGALGNVQTQTVRAFSAAEMSQFLSRMVS